jgi:two-component system chemotaxis response regulator CheY
MNKILLVNDCRFESMIMKDMLNNLGYDVYTSDEYNVLPKIKELSPNILICNLVMKDIKGDELIRKVKRIFLDIRCYISSSNDIKFEDYKNWVEGVIKTPTNTDQLIKILGNIKIEKADRSDYLLNNTRKDAGEELFKRLKEKEGTAGSKEVKGEPKIELASGNYKVLKYCPYCGDNIEKFNSTITFCPFCGGKLK